MLGSIVISKIIPIYRKKKTNFFTFALNPSNAQELQKISESLVSSEC